MNCNKNRKSQADASQLLFLDNQFTLRSVNKTNDYTICTCTRTKNVHLVICIPIVPGLTPMMYIESFKTIQLSFLIHLSRFSHVDATKSYLYSIILRFILHDTIHFCLCYIMNTQKKWVIHQMKSHQELQIQGIMKF